MGVTFPSCPHYAWHPVSAFFTSQSALLLYSYEKIIRWIWQRTMQTHYMPEFVDILHSVCRQVQPFYIKVIESVIVHFIWTQLHFVHIIQASVWLRYCGLDL